MLTSKFIRAHFKFILLWAQQSSYTNKLAEAAARRKAAKVVCVDTNHSQAAVGVVTAAKRLTG